jgi:hypothetical protein
VRNELFFIFGRTPAGSPRRCAPFSVRAAAGCRFLVPRGGVGGGKVAAAGPSRTGAWRGGASGCAPCRRHRMGAAGSSGLVTSVGRGNMGVKKGGFRRFSDTKSVRKPPVKKSLKTMKSGRFSDKKRCPKTSENCPKTSIISYFWKSSLHRPLV